MRLLLPFVCLLFGGCAVFFSESDRELGSFGGSTPWPNSTPYEENTKRPVLVGRIRLVPDGLVNRLPKRADANRSRTKKSPGLLARRRAGRQHLNKHHGQLTQLLCATGP